MYNQYLLSNDRYSRKLTDSDHLSIVSLAQDVASKLADTYSIDKIYEKLQEDGFIFKNVTNSEDSKFIYFRARILIEKDQKTIFIYEDTVKKAAERYQKPEQFFSDLYIAHEFFHYLEYLKVVELSYKVVRTKFLGHKFYGNVDAISEIGANYFAMNVLNTKFNPMQLDLEEMNV